MEALYEFRKGTLYDSLGNKILWVKNGRIKGNKVDKMLICRMMTIFDESNVMHGDELPDCILVNTKKARVRPRKIC